MTQHTADESHPFPHVVTDEEVLAALNAHSRHLYPGHTEQRTLIWWRAPAVGAMRRALAAALSAAPTTDEDDPSVDYHAMWWKAEREREQAEAFAALWKETARRLARKIHDEDGNLPTPATDEDARTYTLEQIEAAQAETTEAVTRAEKAEARAEKAEQELYELHAALAVLRR